MAGAVHHQRLRQLILIQIRHEQRDRPMADAKLAAEVEVATAVAGEGVDGVRRRAGHNHVSVPVAVAVRHRNCHRLIRGREIRQRRKCPIAVAVQDVHGE